MTVKEALLVVGLKKFPTSESVLKKAIGAAVAKGHPDNGGTARAFQKAIEARKVLNAAFGVKEKRQKLLKATAVKPHERQVYVRFGDCEPKPAKMLTGADGSAYTVLNWFPWTTEFQVRVNDGGWADIKEAGALMLDGVLIIVK
jgi:hypothetical protein